MAIRISRPMTYSDRHATQQADQSIKREVVRALVELVTNSDDSYKKVGGNRTADGVITIDIERRHTDSIIRVLDHAEGIDGPKLDEILGSYAEDTSGFSEGQPVRGYFGRGLKDAILGMGRGEVRGFSGNRCHIASLEIRDGRPHYEAQEPLPIPAAWRAEMMFPGHPAATIVEITVSRPDVRMPRFDNLRQQLSLHRSLRDILSDSKRTVLLRNKGTRLNRELQLTYKYPRGESLASTQVPIPGFSTEMKVDLFRSDTPLTTPREEGPFAQGGLLICGKHAIFDSSMFKFDGDPVAQVFYGRITIPYIDLLLERNEPIIQATRDGVDWAHPFAKALRTAIEDFLTPFVDEEGRKARAEVQRVRDEHLSRKLSAAVSSLNDIARQELSTQDTEGKPQESFYIPEGGFGFVPEYYSIVSGHSASILVRSRVPDVVPANSVVAVSSDSSEVGVDPPHATLVQRDDYPNVGEARISLTGRQVGTEAILTARCEGQSAEALVRVIARREPAPQIDPPTHPPKRRSGMFNEITFDDSSTPRLRVRYDRETGNVVISVKHASVAPYVGPGGQGANETAQGQVMLAELITEALCREVARRGIDTGRWIAAIGGEAEGCATTCYPPSKRIRWKGAWDHRRSPIP